MIALYSHSGSLNHGCEAIIRSTKKVINRPMILYSLNASEDYKYNIQEIYDVKLDEDHIPKKPSIKYYLAASEMKLFKTTRLLSKFRRSSLLSDVHRGDVFIAVGGDNYCYNGREVLGDINYWLHKKRAKTILWGCSIEPSVLNKAVLEDLKRYNAITVRESISFKALKNAGLNNIKLCADSAFLLDKKDVNLPEKFVDTSFVGINVSPLILEYGDGAKIKKNYERLIDYILENTEYSIMFVPHVISPQSDDRSAIGSLVDKIKKKERVFVLNDCTCEELKGYISKCKFFVGARTHSIIAAYSTMVPTLAVGYSVKAKGIAKDIFGEYESYVIPVQHMSNEDDLLQKMLQIMDDEGKIRRHLQNVMPDYKKKAYEGLYFIKNLIV